MIQLDWTTISDKWVIYKKSYINSSHISNIDFVTNNLCRVTMDSGKFYEIKGKENINAFWQILFGKDYKENE